MGSVDPRGVLFVLVAATCCGGESRRTKPAHVETTDGNGTGAETPTEVAKCGVEQLSVFPIEAVPLKALTRPVLAGDGSFWIVGTRPSDLSRPTASLNSDSTVLGRLDASGLSILRELPSGTLPSCHGLTADGRHWIAGQSTGPLASDAASVDRTGSGWRGYLVELDAHGDVRAAGDIPGIPSDCLADPQGGVFLAGNQLAWSASLQLFWARYDAHHELSWTQGFPSMYELLDSGGLIALGQDDNIVAGAELNDDLLLAKLDRTGALLWNHRWGAPIGSDRPRGLVLDSADNVWFSGFYNRSIDLGGGALPERDDFTEFLAKFDPDGEHVLSFPVSRALTMLTVDATDHLWASADDCPVSCGHPKVVERYDAAGNLECELDLGATPYALAADGDGVWVFGGAYGAVLDAATPDGGYATFLARLRGAQ